MKSDFNVESHMERHRAHDCSFWRDYARENGIKVTEKPRNQSAVFDTYHCVVCGKAFQGFMTGGRQNRVTCGDECWIELLRRKNR